MWFGFGIRKDIVIVIVIVIVTISRYRCDLDQERYCRTNYYFYSQSHGEYRMSWAQHLEKHEVVEIQFCKKRVFSATTWFSLQPTTLAAYLEAHNGYVGQVLAQVQDIFICLSCRSMASTGWSTSTTLSLCRICSRSSTTSTMMSLL